jgi:phosphoglycerate dehydrogenase-like enzyme
VVGLVSLGHIGRLVRERLRAHEVTVLAYDPHLPAQAFERLDVESVSLPELMRRSDVVSLHTPLNDQTRGLINHDLLSRMKRGASLLNTARGGVVDERALVDFLRSRTDVQALLDVTDPMPSQPDSPLFELPNVFLTPHIAGSLGPECRRMGRLMVSEFERYLRGQPLQHLVTREQAELQT